jgi:hypothetical protein
MENIPKTFMTILCDISNIQKYNLKKCSLPWMAPLTKFLPIYKFLCRFFGLLNTHKKTFEI